MYGQNFNSTVTGQLLGTSGDDTLNASGVGTTDKKLIGGLGNDTLIGDANTNVLYGGAGNDTLEIVDTTFRRIDGGSGIDLLRAMLAGGTLDLAALNDEAIRSIERIDTTNATNETVRLALRDVLNISETMVVAAGNNYNLILDGNSNDSVDFVETVGAGGWNLVGSADSVSFEGKLYSHYRHDDDNAHVLIQQGLIVG